MSDEYTDAQLIGKYIELDNKIKAMSEAHKAAIKPYQEACTALTAALHMRLNQRGTKSTSVDGVGQCFKMHYTQVKCYDKAAYLRWCFSNPDEGASILTANVAKDALLAYMEKSRKTVEGPNGPQEIETPPDGLTVEYGETVQIRRA